MGSRRGLTSNFGWDDLLIGLHDIVKGKTEEKSHNAFRKKTVL
jgi:hypothetical protein